VPAPDRRTIGELLADSDALARETLLDATPENAPAMVRSWNQLVASAAHLWAALSSPPDHMSGSDPMERLRVVGEAIARSVRAGHWPGHGPTDDHLKEIADTLSRARHLIERDGRPSGRRPRTDRPTPPQMFTARCCTRCMSPPTERLSHSVGMSRGCSTDWRSAPADDNQWLSGQPPWRSPRRRA
jgi:hypothetical protein